MPVHNPGGHLLVDCWPRGDHLLAIYWLFFCRWLAIWQLSRRAVDYFYPSNYAVHPNNGT